MKKTVLFITFLTILNIANGQLNHPIDSLIYSDVRYFMIIDSLKVEGLRNNIDKSCIFVNGRPIDSTKISCDGIPVWYKNNLFFNTESKNLSKKIMYSPHDGVKKYSSVFSVDNGFAQYYSYDYTNIYVVNPLSGDRKLYTNYDKIPDCVVSGFFIDAARACVIHCCDGVEACDYIRCYLTSSAETKEITQQILQTFNEKDAVLTDLNFNFITNDGKYLHLGVQYMSDQHNVKRKTFSRIFDLKFNFIGNALNIQDSYINGVNIQNNHIQNYFLSSWTDTKDSIKIKKRAIYPYKNVIVPYRFNPVLELAMYKAYHNNLLIHNDIQRLEKYELNILRNLIFAKYNYAFSSEFYQAYFSLYEFYGNDQSRTSRVKDVDHLLTEADKANIKMIKEAGL